MANRDRWDDEDWYRLRYYRSDWGWRDYGPYREDYDTGPTFHRKDRQL